MYRLRIRKIILLILLAGLYITANAQNYVFAQLTGSPVNTSGWNLQGAATPKNILYTDNSEILICNSDLFKSGAVFFNQPINLSICSKWKAEFDFRMFDGSGADGLAFCFLDVPPVGFITGSGLGIPGTANGLKVCFDTYNNCGAATTKTDMPKVEIRWGSGYNECAAQPTQINTGGALDAIRANAYCHAKVEYDNGLITVSVNNKVVLTGNQQFTFTGYLGFTASTGGSSDNHSIRNVVIYTDMPPSVAYSSPAVAFCPNTPLTLGTTGNDTYTYSWSPSIGLSSLTVSNPIVQLDNSTDTVITAKYYVQTAFMSNAGCYSRDSVTVSVYPKPDVHFQTPAICLNDATASFTDSSYTKDQGSLPFGYLWNFDDAGHASLSNPDTSVLQNPSHVYGSAANYHVQLKVASARGCADSLVKTFTVNGSVPHAAIQVKAGSIFCGNDSVYFKDHSSVDFGAVTKVEIYWDALHSPSVKETDNHPYAGKNYAHLYPASAMFVDTVYQVRYIAYSGITCYNESDTVINVLASPKVIFDSLPSTCSNAMPVQLTEGHLQTLMSGNFIYSGTATNSTGLFDPQLSGAGVFSIRYSFTANNGCKDSAIRNMVVWAPPMVDAGPDIFVLEGSGARINATVTGSAATYNWTPAVFLDSSHVLNPTVTPHADTMYHLTVTDSYSCSNTDSVFVKVLFAPQVPNVFSPNGDGINDTWEIKYLGDYPDCTIEVFNRSGQMLYQSQGYSKPWDGRSNGSPLPIGTYYYVIRFKNGRAPVGGSVTIIR